MSDLEIYNQFVSLPDHLKNEVKDFIEFLKSKSKSKEKKPKKKREFGCAKGFFVVAPDFDDLIICLCEKSNETIK